MLLPAPLGPTSATVSPGATARLKSRERRMLRPRRVAEGHVVELDRSARGRGRERLRRRRRDDRRLHLQQLHQPLGRAGGAQQVAVDLRQHGDAADEDDHVDDRLAEVAGADLAAHDRLRALVQAPEQRAEGRADDERDQERPHLRAAHGGAERALGRRREARGLARPPAGSSARPGSRSAPRRRSRSSRRSGPGSRARGRARAGRSRATAARR